MCCHNVLNALQNVNIRKKSGECLKRHMIINESTVKTFAVSAPLASWRPT